MGAAFSSPSPPRKRGSRPAPDSIREFRAPTSLHRLVPPGPHRDAARRGCPEPPGLDPGAGHDVWEGASGATNRVPDGRPTPVTPTPSSSWPDSFRPSTSSTTHGRWRCSPPDPTRGRRTECRTAAPPRHPRESGGPGLPRTRSGDLPRPRSWGAAGDRLADRRRGPVRCRPTHPGDLSTYPQHPFSKSTDCRNKINIIHLFRLQAFRNNAAVKEALPNRIKECRQRRGLTQCRLAELVNATTQQISHLERGERQLTLHWMVRIGAALRCDPADLLPSMDSGGEDDPREEALLALFRALPSADQDSLLRIGRAMAQPDTAIVASRRAGRTHPERRRS